MEKRLNIGIVLGLLSFAVDALVSTLLFPLLLKHLGKTDAGFWMLFSSLGALLGCLLSGLAPTTSRLVGAVSGQQSGNAPDPQAWAKARISLGRVYLVTLAAGGLIGLALIPLYLSDVGAKSDRSTLLIGVAWTFYLIGWLLRGIIQRNFSTLDGLGEVGYNRVVNTLGGLVNLVLLLWLLPKGFGVYAPVSSFVTVALVVCLVSYKLLKDKAPKGWWASLTLPWSDSWPVGKDALNMFVLGATSYVVGQSCILFVERGEGVVTLATFAPIARIVALMAGAACLPNTMMMPLLAKAFNGNETGKFRRLVWMCLTLAPALYLIPGLLLAIYPREVFGWWLGEDNFMGETPTRLMLLYGLVYCIHSSIAVPALAVRYRSFVREATINMVLVLILMPLLASRFGLWGYPAGMILGTLIPSIMVCWQSYGFLKGRI